MAEYRATFRSYGVEFSILSNDRAILAEASEVASHALLGNVVEIEAYETQHKLTLRKVKNGIHFKLGSDDHGVTPWPKLAHFFDTCVRLVVAEFAVDKVFIHCGVVVWKGQTILFPGDSYSGKTTMVAEFVKRGATYYSDEYAIIDENGDVHPFVRPLSIRHKTDFSLRHDTPAESLGGTLGRHAVPVDLVFLLQYVRNSRFRPAKLTAGEALMHLMPFAISLRSNPKFTLLLLNKVCDRANVFKSNRGQSEKVANKIIDLIDKIDL
ncbi:MAG TPA: hypothetical protein PKA82_09295 [Pyrinomonadaceae bacterium]|nr:hypothetical protein [Pyrinomonadaceae bacterium]